MEDTMNIHDPLVREALAAIFIIAVVALAYFSDSDR